MNSFEINKILGAVLGTCLILLAVHIASGAIFSPPVPAKPGYEIAVKEEQPAGQQQAKAAPAEPVRRPAGELLRPSAAPRSPSSARSATTCRRGKAPRSVPISMASSAARSHPWRALNTRLALKAKGGTWTFDALNKWLTDPRADVPGTAMTFAGIANEKQRADVIAYLNTLSAHPLPLPTAKSAGAPAANPAPSASASTPPPATRRRRRADNPTRRLRRRRRNRPLTPCRSPPTHGDVKSISSRRAPACWRRN